MMQPAVRSLVKENYELCAIWKGGRGGLAVVVPLI